MPRDAASRADARSDRSSRAKSRDLHTLLARLRGLPVVALLIVALLALSAAWAIDPIRDAATGQVVTEDATLERTGGYLLLAPVSAILDTITLLSVRQHIALVLTMLLAWLLWWWFSRRERDLAVAPARRVVRIVARV